MGVVFPRKARSCRSGKRLFGHLIGRRVSRNIARPRQHSTPVQCTRGVYGLFGIKDLADRSHTGLVEMGDKTLQQLELAPLGMNLRQRVNIGSNQPAPRRNPGDRRRPGPANRRHSASCSRDRRAQAIANPPGSAGTSSPYPLPAPNGFHRARDFRAKSPEVDWGGTRGRCRAVPPPDCPSTTSNRYPALAFQKALVERSAGAPGIVPVS